MKGFALTAAAVASAGLATASPTAVTRTEASKVDKRASAPAVSASGNAFWANGERFYVRGIDYQPGGEAASEDPLANTAVCDRDIKMFKDLGINTVRVYITDNKADHDHCMNQLSEAGIYVMIDANNPKYSINRANPHKSYNAAYLQSVFATIDEFAKYDNTLAFFSGNEVINDEKKFDTTLAAPYVKATTRDMRNYIKARGYRAIPVGYSAADVSDNRMQTAQYFNCGDDDDARSDFFAFNDYSWCSSDYKTAGWDQKVKNFTDYGLPIFLSEWGCNTNPRDFGELSALMDASLMTSVYSGGLMYEYTNKEDNFGIVEVKSETEVEKRPEFDAFKSALAKYPAPTGDGGAATSTHAVECPSKADNWNVDPSAALPSLPTNAQQYMDSGAGTGPGLNGPGSQEAGEDAPASGSGNNGDDENASSRFGESSMAVGVLLAFVLGVVVI